MTSRTYKGKCFCGAVEVTVTGATRRHGLLPLRFVPHWSARPSTRSRYGAGHRQDHRRRGKPRELQQDSKKRAQMVQALRRARNDPASEQRVDRRLRRDLPELDFKPREHVHYQEAVLHIVDSLPKHKDLPKAAGGSGVLLPSLTASGAATATTADASPRRSGIPCCR